MKQFIVSAILVSFVLVLTVPMRAEDKVVHKYVGVTICAPCHKAEKAGKQFDIWKGSKHADAFNALTTPKADELAKAKGLKTAAKESPECLKCHVTGYGEDAKVFAASFKQTDGVQCETCHGAGSDYKTMSLMKDKDKAIAAGLTIFKDDPKLCVKCHNEGSPTHKEFKYEDAWGKIKHPMPKKG